MAEVKFGISFVEQKIVKLCNKCKNSIATCVRCSKRFNEMDEIYCEYENGHPYHSFAHYHLWCVTKEEIDKIERGEK